MKAMQQEGKTINLTTCRGKKYKTNIIGLDTLLRDGIVLPPHHSDSIEDNADGIVILIKGKPGTGKTTFGIQLTTGLTRSFLKNTVNTIGPGRVATISNSRIYSIEQSKEELEDKLLDIEISRIFDDLKAGRIPTGDKAQKAIDKINKLFEFPKYLKDKKGKWKEEFFKSLKYSCIENTLYLKINYNDFDKKELRTYYNNTLPSNIIIPVKIENKKEEEKILGILDRNLHIPHQIISNWYKCKSTEKSTEIIKQITNNEELNDVDNKEGKILHLISRNEEYFSDINRLSLKDCNINDKEEKIILDLLSKNLRIPHLILKKWYNWEYSKEEYRKVIEQITNDKKLEAIKNKEEKILHLISRNEKLFSDINRLITEIKLNQEDLKQVRDIISKLDKNTFKQIYQTLINGIQSPYHLEDLINANKDNTTTSVENLNYNIAHAICTYRRKDENIEQEKTETNKNSSYPKNKIYEILSSTEKRISKCDLKGFSYSPQKIIQEIRDKLKLDAELTKSEEKNQEQQASSKIASTFNIDIKSDSENTQNSNQPYSISPAQRIINIINELEDNETSLFPCVVIDGMNILNEQERKIINLSHAIKILKRKAFFSVIILDGVDEKNLFQEYLTDMVIQLRGEEKTNQMQYFLHDLQISKSRFQAAAFGWHQYKLRDFGLQVFKSIHFHIHKNNYMDSQMQDSFKPISSYKKEPKQSEPQNIESKFSLSIEKILFTPSPGSFTVILGPRAAFKTTLSLSFLYGKMKDKNEGDSLLVSLVDNISTIQESCNCPFYQKEGENSDNRKKTTCKKCSDHFYIFHLRPGCITASEFFYYLEQRIEEHEKKIKRPITRLAFWDLTQLEYRFPLFLSDPMFLPGLVEFGKKNNIAMFVMGAGNSQLTPAASAIADNVIFCWRDKPSNEISIISTNTNTQDTKKEIQLEEFLSIYVDRSEGRLGHEGKELTCLPINIKPDGGKKIKLICPNYYDTEKKQDQSKDHKLSEKETDDLIGFIKVQDENSFKNAKEMIHAITELQGMGGAHKTQTSR